MPMHAVFLSLAVLVPRVAWTTEEASATVRPTNPDLIAEKCLSKTKSFGKAPAASTTAFDQTSAITEQLVAQATPYEWNMCLDKNDALISIQISYIDASTNADTGTPNNTIIKLPRTGPSGGTCFS